MEENYTLKEKRLLIYVILSMFLLSFTIMISEFYRGYIHENDLQITLYFIKLFNIIISLLGVISCYIMYNRTKYDSIFIITLMYIVLSIGIIFGEVDYFPFNIEYSSTSLYVVITSSIFRMILLILSVIPKNKSKIKDIILRNKSMSVIIIIILTIGFRVLEVLLTTNNFKYGPKFIAYYTILFIVANIICSIILFFRAFKRNEFIYIVLSSSIFMLIIKATYSLYIPANSTFYTKLVSISFTYLCFFILIIGALIELFMHMSRTNRLHDKLNLFYNIMKNDKHTYMMIFDSNINLVYANEKVKKKYFCSNSMKKLEKVLRQRLKNSLYDIELKEIAKTLSTTNYWRESLYDNIENKTYDCRIELVNDTKYILVTYLDITELINKKLEVENLKIYDKEKTEFIANISHELKTPLNIFSSTVQLLNKSVENEKLDFRDIYTKYNNVLLTNCDRMTRLIRNIMDLSKIDMGVVEADFKNYNIVSIVEDITLSVVDYALLKNINIQFDTNIEEHIIKCDADMIERIILNLLSNAIKFSPKNSSIFVDILVDEENVHISVKDEGIGISKENQHIIFEKFVQIDKSFTRQNEGSGIGLSIVKSLISIHKGTICVESNLNEGSLFKLTLPNKSIENDESVIYDMDKHKVKVELSDIYELS